MRSCAASCEDPAVLLRTDTLPCICAGSHTLGVVNDRPGAAFLEASQVPEVLAAYPSRPLPLQAGEIVLLSTLCLHSSGVNRTGQSRRALSTCLMDGETRYVSDVRELFPSLLAVTVCLPACLCPHACLLEPHNFGILTLMHTREKYPRDSSKPQVALLAETFPLIVYQYCRAATLERQSCSAMHRIQAGLATTLRLFAPPWRAPSPLVCGRNARPCVLTYSIGYATLLIPARQA